MQQDGKTKHYRIDSWIYIQADEPYVMDSIEDARMELRHCQFMSPKDRFEIVECDEQGNDIALLCGLCVSV